MAKRFDYFETLAKQGDFAVREAEMLLTVLRDFDPEQLPAMIIEMHELENAADSQIHQIFTHLATEFITPIDREDILSMGQRLDDIVDYIEDVLQLLHMYNVQAIHEPALTLAEIILASTKVLKQGLEEFSGFRKSNKMVRKYIVEVNDLEEQADQVYAEAMNKLFRTYTDQPLFVMIWSDLFARLERVTDACENVADMMDTIILKNS
jgi:predicted phosphate transport protein (TIGR00153 family)